MSLRLRKVVVHTEETHLEGGREASPPLVMHGVAAVIANPWVEQGFVEDLRPMILEIAPKLGELLVPRLVGLCGSPDAVEAYGKAA
ncbi:MAG TPA: peptide synthetase, partial [Acidimicrobiaceae bacterium]|nr:peptide synthetase [Acidimicrobiaceae bacterium]